MKQICKWISDWMGVLVLVSAILALAFPEVVGHLKPSLINPLLGVIMFGMGLTLRWRTSAWCSPVPKTYLSAAWRSSR